MHFLALMKGYFQGNKLIFNRFHIISGEGFSFITSNIVITFMDERMWMILLYPRWFYIIGCYGLPLFQNNLMKLCGCFHTNRYFTFSDLV